MKRHIIRFGIAALLVTVPTSVLAESVCVKKTEARAERVRILQTELMVAALKCRSREDLGLYNKYNEFVQKFMPQLVTHGKVLTDYFKRRHGAGFRPHMDRYITSLANAVSIASDKTPDFCETSASVAEEILQASPMTIADADFNLRMAPETAISTCIITDDATSPMVATASED